MICDYCGSVNDEGCECSGRPAITGSAGQPLDLLVLRETFTQTLGIMEPWDAAIFLACLDEEPAEYAAAHNLTEADVLACLERARAVYADLRDGATPEKAREMYLAGLG